MFIGAMCQRISAVWQYIAVLLRALHMDDSHIEEILNIRFRRRCLSFEKLKRKPSFPLFATIQVQVQVLISKISCSQHNCTVCLWTLKLKSVFMSARDDGLVLGSKILCKYAKSMQHSIGNVFMSWMSLHYQHKQESKNISCSQQYLRKSDMGKKRVTLRDDNLEEEFTFSILFDSILTSHSHTSLSSGKKSI